MHVFSVTFLRCRHTIKVLINLYALLAGLKVHSEECEKDIQEWKKRASNATTSLSKLNRQINTKVVIGVDYLSFLILVLS